MNSDAPNIRALHNEQVGRYLVANREFQPGDVIFCEKPFAFGPKADTLPICLGCYKPSDCSTLCSKCGWPVCGKDCEDKAAHRDAECKIFASAGVRFQHVEDVTEPSPQFECIMPLRVLTAKENNSDRWEKEIKGMEAHNAIRKLLPIWQVNQVNVVNFLLGPCKLRDRADEELLHTICGIIEINSFEGRSITGYAVRILYPQFALMSHNCVSNITHSIIPLDISGEEFKLTVRASVKIAVDGELFSSYTHSLGATLIRREYLREGKYFDCTCARCTDPTELGTHMSTMICHKCNSGFVMSTNPLDAAASWNCNNCNFTAKGETIKKVFMAIQTELDRIELTGHDSNGIEQREKMLRKYQSILHPKHSFMTILRHSLSEMYGRIEEYMLEDLPDILLERKADLCRDLLQVLNIIEPGYTRIRGITLYELHAPLMLLAKNLYRAKIINKEGLKERLLECINLLEESSKILSFEPSSSPEGIMGQVATKSLQQLKDNLDTIIKNV